VIREIVAGELERLGDERLEMVTVTGVRVDGSLDTADVFYSAFTAEEDGRLDELDEAFEDVRWRIQKKVNGAIRARRTPQIRFRPDDVLEGALRIEEIIESVSPRSLEGVADPLAGDSGDLDIDPSDGDDSANTDESFDNRD
jgi:ribosome-binding factor A